MRSEINKLKNNKEEKALASYFLKFLCQPTFGTFAKSHEPTHNQNFVKEPNLANLSAEQAGAQLTSILVMTNWNSYDR